MLKARVVFSLLFIFSPFHGKAQNEVVPSYCMVLAAQGNVRVNGEPISRGDKLMPEDCLELTGKSDFVSLLFSNGFVKELDETGLYDAVSLKKGQDEVNDFISQGSWYVKYEFHPILRDFGSIIRNSMELLPTNWINIIKTDPVKISWKVLTDDTPEEFSVKFTNVFDEPIKNFKTTEPGFEFDPKKLMPDSEDSMIIYSIGFYNGKDSIKKEGLLKLLKDNKPEMTSNKAGDWIVKAFELESDQLHYPHLKQYYLRAMELAPHVEDYRHYYHQYLLRKHLSVYKEIESHGYFFSIDEFTGDCLYNGDPMENGTSLKWDDVLQVRTGEIQLRHVSGREIKLKPGTYNTYELCDLIY